MIDKEHGLQTYGWDCEYYKREDVDKLLNSLSDGWISVEDELPDNEDIVLIRAKDQYEEMVTRRGYYSQTYDEPVWCFASGFTTDVTHWQPLPAPPEDTNG